MRDKDQKETGKKARVFVYGTLLADEHNNHHLEDADLVGAGTLRGAYTMFNLGHYPAVVELDGPEREVVGEVYEVELDTVYRSLDRLEGVDRDDPENRDGDGRGLYYRREVEVEVDGDAVEVWVYLMTPERCGGRGFLPSGSWRERDAA